MARRVTGPHRGNRYGRSEAARIAVLQAADDLLVERGFAGVTIEGIAARAHVAKQTIYRWWRSKTDVLFEALVVDVAEHFRDEDHGDLQRDLRAYLRELATFLTCTDAGAVCRALIGEAQHDGAVARRFRTEFTGIQRERERAIFARAGHRGDALPTEFDPAIDRLVAPLYYRVLVSGEPVTTEFTNALVDRFMMFPA